MVSIFAIVILSTIGALFQVRDRLRNLLPHRHEMSTDGLPPCHRKSITQWSVPSKILNPRTPQRLPAASSQQSLSTWYVPERRCHLPRPSFSIYRDLVAGTYGVTMKRYTLRHCDRHSSFSVACKRSYMYEKDERGRYRSIEGGCDNGMCIEYCYHGPGLVAKDNRSYLE